MSVIPPRLPLAVLPTPLVRARRAEVALGCGPLLIKRDDLIGFGVAGNKARSLEYLVGAAVAQGAEVLVTGGGPGSNFVAAAAMAARVAGLDCELVIWGDTAGAPNIALAVATGAVVLPTGGTDRAEVDMLVAEHAAELTAAGRQAFAVPRGGSTALGALGFFDAATELAVQLAARSRPEARNFEVGDDVLPSAIVLAVGSGGSCAGLLAGLAAWGLDVPVVGVSVSRPPEEIRATVLALAGQCAALRGTSAPSANRLELVDARGPGFGRATPKEEYRALVALRTEGLLLDTTYGAEAFTVAVDLATRRRPVVWWHTGGLIPAVHRVAAEANAQAIAPGTGES